jgi:TM2 domain-containing membrane protein YozV
MDRAKVQSGKTKSHALAIILALFAGGWGVHRFYLGYGWQGALQAMALPFFGLAMAAFQVPGGFTEIAAITTGSVLLAASLALAIWRWVDFARITNESLTPKNGVYR